MKTLWLISCLKCFSEFISQTSRHVGPVWIPGVDSPQVKTFVQSGAARLLFWRRRAPVNHLLWHRLVASSWVQCWEVAWPLASINAPVDMYHHTWSHVAFYGQHKLTMLDTAELFCSEFIDCCVTLVFVSVTSVVRPSDTDCVMMMMMGRWRWPLLEHQRTSGQISLH